MFLKKRKQVEELIPPNHDLLYNQSKDSVLLTKARQWNRKETPDTDSYKYEDLIYDSHKCTLGRQI